jgi:acyl carrier protein
MKAEIEKIVFKIISKNLNIDEKKISLNLRIEDLSQDSIQLFQLIIAFEKEFKKQVQYEDLMQIITVGDIIEYVKKNK